jgi:hypothetical protein
MRLFIVISVACAALVASVTAQARLPRPCGWQAYSYAGVETQRPVYGVSASISALQAPDVTTGHVAGWIGVSGQGGNGWIQIGLSAVPGSRTNEVYLEYAPPGRDPQYSVLRSAVPVGERHRFTVSQVARRPGWWQASIDGAPVTRPVYLAGSNGGWRAQVLGESWNDNSRACNVYSYAFNTVSLAPAHSLAWGQLDAFSSFQDAGYALSWRSHSDFVVSNLARR